MKVELSGTELCLSQRQTLNLADPTGVRITARRVLGGESARLVRPPERPTRVYVLWGVLVLSVVMLALFFASR